MIMGEIYEKEEMGREVWRRGWREGREGEGRREEDGKRERERWRKGERQTDRQV